MAVLKVFLVKNELDVGFRVGQTLFLQRLAQLWRPTEEHSNFGSAEMQIQEAYCKVAFWNLDNGLDFKR